MNSCWKISILLMFLTASYQIHGQANRYSLTKRANLRVGANYNFQNGVNFDSLFQSGKGSLQGNMFLGYRFDPSGGKANYFGVFGALSTIQPTSLNRMKDDNALVLPSGYNQGKATIVEIEGGFIFGNWFRISFGPGTLQIPTTGNNTVTYKYLSGTTGFIINLGAMKLNLNASSQFGGDLEKNVWRAGVGLGFGFDFLNARY